MLGAAVALTLVPVTPAGIPLLIVAAVAVVVALPTGEAAVPRSCRRPAEAHPRTRRPEEVLGMASLPMPAVQRASAAAVRSASRCR